jgi:DNA-directed RNA polymerase specialized sigma subunit
MRAEYLNNKIFESVIIEFQNSKTQKMKYDLLYSDVEFHKCTSKKDNPKISIPEDEPRKSQAIYQKAQEELANAFHMLSQNIVRYAKFNHIDEDDAVQEGVMICFERVDKFNPAKGKAFNYMTTCILNHFRQLYRSAKNYQDLKKKISEMLQIKTNSSNKGRGRDKNSKSYDK